MSNQAFTEILTFTRCANWNTDTCPHLKKPQDAAIHNQQIKLVRNER